MKRNNFNLLICLDALLTERSVTRAAERLEMSQPGMSNALLRLRELTGDPLLVRSGNSLLLTERGQALARKVRAGIELMDDIFANEGPLDLAAATDTVTLAAADSVGMAIVPSLARTLAEAAPGVTLDVRAPDPDHLYEWLSEGECDLGVGHFPDLHPDLRSTRLFTQSLSCLTARVGSDAPLTLESFLQRRHVVFGSPFSPRSTLEQTITRALSAAGHERARMVRVSSVLLIPYAILGSDYVATLPTWLCRHFASFLELHVSAVPVTLPDIECVMVWHERTHRQALRGWVRERIRDIVPGKVATGLDIRDVR